MSEGEAVSELREKAREFSHAWMRRAFAGGKVDLMVIDREQFAREAMAVALEWAAVEMSAGRLGRDSCDCSDVFGPKLLAEAKRLRQP